MKFQVIDLFCGAGGVTEGIQKATFCNNKIAEVIACINHDEIAIQSHQFNHRSTLHFTEDIRIFDLHKLPSIDRSKIIVLWASLECTNFSKAKGGKPRDADSRTLAEHLYRYIEYINPDYIMIENVREFMSWGPLDLNGKPVSMDKGKDYSKWVSKIKNYGYEYNYKLLDAANFGAYCLRYRYFGLFSKPGLPSIFPEPTHSKRPNRKLKLKKWRPVKNVLDLKDEGKSIFDRKKNLSENTLKRIYEGLKKFATREHFVVNYNGSRVEKGELKANPGSDIYNPSPTVTTQNRLGIVNKCFISKYYSGYPEHKNNDVNVPSATITTNDRLALVNCRFLHTFHGKNGKIYSKDRPSVCIPTKDEIAFISPIHFIDLQFSNGTKNHTIEDPSHAILTVNKKSLVTSHFLSADYSNATNGSTKSPSHAILSNPKNNIVSCQFIINRQYNNKAKSIDEISNTIIAQQGKRPMYLISPVCCMSDEFFAIILNDEDSEVMKDIKIFMAENGIVDIKMRMLKVSELKSIMGLRKNYKLYGNQTKQKWMIGNMVHPKVPKKWFEDLYSALLEQEEINKAA